MTGRGGRATTDRYEALTHREWAESRRAAQEALEARLRAAKTLTAARIPPETEKPVEARSTSSARSLLFLRLYGTRNPPLCVCCGKPFTPSRGRGRPKRACSAFCATSERNRLRRLRYAAAHAA